MSDPTDLELSRIVEHAEARVWSDMTHRATPEIREALGLQAIPVGGGVVTIASRVPSLLYNRAFAFGLEEPIDEDTLDRMIGLYRPDVPFTIQPSPFARPGEIRAWLEARGIPSRFNWVKWLREARPPAKFATDLAIERIGPDLASRFGELAFTVFHGEPPTIRPWFEQTIGKPGWTHYLAFDHDQPAALAALYVTEGVGWLGWGGTLSSHRGRGAQSALIERRLRDGIAQGCRWFTVETADDLPEKPNPSFRNVARAGFRLLYRRPSHAHVPPGPRASAPAASTTAAR